MLNHVIKNQVIELHYTKNDSIDHWDSKVRELFHTKILPGFNEICENMDLQNKIVSIDKLNIDLGTIRPDDLNSRFADIVINAMDSELRNHRVFRDIDDIKHLSDKVIVKSLASSIGEHLVFFLEKGHMPWEIFNISWDEFEELLGRFFENSDENEIRKLYNQIQQNQFYVKRIATQFSTNLISKIESALLKEASNSSKSLLKILDWTSDMDKDLFSILRSIRLFISEEDNDSKERQKTISMLLAKKHLRQRTVNNDFEDRYMTEQRLYILIAANQTNIGIAVHKYLRRLFQNNGCSENEISVLTRYTLIHPDYNTIESNCEKGSSRIDPKRKYIKDISKVLEKDASEVADNITSVSNKDEIYIKNAGLVIIHPFLELLFDNFGWLSNQAFISIAQKQRAAYLLQYIATGRDYFNEYELVFNKILTGIPINYPIALEEELFNQEKQEVNKLLNKFKESCRSFKNTSVASLRSEFFNRPGKLEIKDGIVDLVVEVRSFDYILNTIPWGLSYIKLPWLDIQIFVNWN